MKSKRTTAVAAALLGYITGAAALNVSHSMFPSAPVPDTPRHGCAVSCSESGPTSCRWGVVHSLGALDRCDKTQLLDANVRFPLEDEDGRTDLRACTASGDTDQNDYGPPCGTGAPQRSTKADVQLLFGESSGGNSTASASPSDVAEAAKELANNLKVDPTCQEVTRIAKKGSAILGLFVGHEVSKSSVVPLIEKFIKYVESTDSLPLVTAAQICGPKGKRSSRHSFGIMADTSGDIKAVHQTLGQWHEAKCLEGLETGETWKDQKFSIVSATAVTMGGRVAASSSNDRTVTARSAAPAHWVPRSLLAPRAECKAYEVQGGDDCYTIATEKCRLKNLDALYKFNKNAKKMCKEGIIPGDHFCCNAGTMPDFSPKPNKDGTCKYVMSDHGDICDTLAKEACDITPKQFYEYNGGGKSDFCDAIQPRKPYCCSPGKKPDLRPKKNKDGTCRSYTIKDKFCDDIKNEFFLKDGDLDKFNKGKTWGWMGCKRLMPGQKICLSDGDPPMPAEDANAQCGPTVVGTPRPSKTKFADLNQCPLNACCNTWGQCGTTEEFCKDTTIDKTPGTAKNNTNGCISNCGTDIVNNKKGPSSFSRVAYFEAWNKNRPCLHMDVDEISDKTYTHVHFSFGTITPTFEINVDDIQEQFDKLKKWSTKVKKIISFGGWAFSTEPETIDVFRNGVKEGNREKFASNVAAFVKKHNLDGVDFDWEYPGADDIPGTSPGSPEDGPNYVAFLKLVKSKLGKDKSVSIAAPASYWYLRHFPIDDIAKIVDYIIYMTYDLHGQWDVDNEYAQPGCKSGKCLRSHVNKTETETALSMVTKAGVPSTKLFIGISSFGRSFKMAKAGCTGANCQYTGKKNKSPAKKGVCTGEAGYLADAEINQIMLIGDSFGGGEYEWFHDDDSDSDMLVYDGVEWVSYMDSTTKEGRVDWYKDLNFGGVSDWAVDLGADRAEKERSDDGGDDIDIGDFKTCDWDAEYKSLEDLAGKSEGLDPVCASVHTLRILSKMLKSSLDGYDDAAKGYDGKFDTYADYIKKTLNTRLEEFMRDKGMKYFTCKAHITETNLDKDDAEDLSCEDVDSRPGMYESWTFWWEFKEKEKKKYEDELWDFGIDPEWVEFGVYRDVFTCDRQSGGTGMCWDTTQTNNGFPRGKDNIEISDPKDIVDKARNNFDNLDDEFFATEWDISMDQWDGSPEDAVQVLSAPVFMLSDAIINMKEVKEMGDKIDKENEKNLILTILSGVLFLIPFVGAAVGSLGRAGANIARMLSAIEAGGAAGLSIYEIIEDPESAPLAIMTMLLGGAGSLGGAKGYRDLAKPRKDLSTNGGAEKMGQTWKEQDPHIQKIMNNSCRSKTK
ncbi:related to chitinase [Cephalotrichum gorgonifer]|uniref:chitinase n=1 Tax=Cephalotrichum gorgonifer TaxID=2041049 RepID=A0AAE8STR7_9PEZI|nr:related to chitinase [Cephalotrichum gorgonifer]